ncbi:MAG TPA: methyltransferase domain-containing protein [Acidimicrobiales bacterium]|jgi:SAM-dependent methyltransferase|nr:methyltransferase domain-containing protein [Acidimicrobiales bacterium]
MEQQAAPPIDPVLAARRKLGPLSDVARRGKLKFFLSRLSKDARILDVGCADNWFKHAAAAQGFPDVTGIDLEPPADIVGDIWDWESLGLTAHSFDVIIAFEVIEHGDFSQPFHDLLKPDGVLFATTPVPRFDPICRFFEAMHLLQQRGSPHSHLTDLRHLPQFDVVERRIKAVISQWAVLRPTGPALVGG